MLVIVMCAAVLSQCYEDVAALHVAMPGLKVRVLLVLRWRMNRCVVSCESADVLCVLTVCSAGEQTDFPVIAIAYSETDNQVASLSSPLFARLCCGV